MMVCNLWHLRRTAGARRAGRASSTVVGVVVALLLAGAVVARPAVVSAQTQSTFDGVYKTLALAPLPGQTPDRTDLDILFVGDVTYDMTLPPGTQLRSGESIRVTGELTGGRGPTGALLLVVSTVAALPGPLLEAAPSTTGVTRVLVILANWTSPDSVTTASARAQVFDDDNAWFQEASYGQLSLSGDVTSWVHIPAPATKCDIDDILVNARSAAQGVGFNYQNYARTMVYFPRTSDCAFAGIAYIADARLWINGYMDRRVTIHEQGHNYGLVHAHSYTCRNGSGDQVVLAPPSACTSSDYGDPFDAMGASNYVGHFGASQKNALGWLGTRIANLVSGASVTLPPYEVNTTSPLVARLNVSPSRTYWFEYRRQRGFDSGLPSGAVDGVLVHMIDPGVIAEGPELLDQRPGPDASFLDAALPFGASWQSPENWRITVGTGNAGGVALSVTLVPNDSFANSLTLTGLSGHAPSTSNAAASKEPGEPNHAGNAGGKSIWYRWTAPAAGALTIDTAGSKFDTLLGVYTGSAVNALTTVAANDNVSSGDLTSKVSFPAVSGTTYQIAMDGFGGASGTAELAWALVVPPPANDAFANAQATSGTSGQAAAVGTSWATKEAGEPNHAGNAGGKSVWYKWTAPTAGSATFTTAGSDFDTLLGVYTGTSVGALTVVASNDDDGNVVTSKVTFPAVSGVVYRIAVDGYGGASGVAKLQWQVANVAPANDNLSGSQALTGPSGLLMSSTNAGATKETGEPNHAGNAGGASVWYRWTAPGAGRVTIDTQGANFDTLLGVYTGAAVNALTQVVANDDDPALAPQSRVVFPTASGASYFIAVDGKNGVTGTFNLRWSLTAVRPAGDYNGDGKTDFSVYRPSTGAWFVKDIATVSWGISGDIPVPGDYNGDGKTDFAVYRPSTGAWFVKDIATVSWGISGDVPVPGDYNGDGKTDVAVYRPSTGAWFVKDVATVGWGLPGDIPVPGDYNGDGKTDIAVYRPSTGAWFVKDIATVSWGLQGDTPLSGDFNGDGKSDFAVYRPSNATWFVKDIATVGWGLAGDRPVPGDFNGDGKTDMAVYRPSNGAWFVKDIATVSWGMAGDIPVVRTHMPEAPQITSTSTYVEGAFVYLRVNYADVDGDAEGFGFRQLPGSSEENHTFAAPSLGRVSPGRVDYPFNQGCGGATPTESDVVFWITDHYGTRSAPVTTHLKC